MTKPIVQSVTFKASRRNFSRCLPTGRQIVIPLTPDWYPLAHFRRIV